MFFLGVAIPKPWVKCIGSLHHQRVKHSSSMIVKRWSFLEHNPFGYVETLWFSTPCFFLSQQSFCWTCWTSQFFDGEFMSNHPLSVGNFTWNLVTSRSAICAKGRKASTWKQSAGRCAVPKQPQQARGHRPLITLGKTGWSSCHSSTPCVPRSHWYPPTYL